MCGIVAIVDTARPVGDETVRRAVEAIGNRGPDGTGIWRAPDGAVALGHARLALRDRAGGGQPLTSEDGQVVVSANGELYGADALRQRLRARGHTLRTGSDSELCVHLYEELGLDMLPLLRGELALLLWDARRRRLVAARDPFGIKPLLYAEHEGRWLFASQARALFAAGLPRVLDEEAAFIALRLQYLPVGRTLFRGVRVLPPGSVGVLESEVWRVARWAHERFPPAPREANRVRIAASFRKRFERAVADRLVGEAPVAFQLSGGVDSGSVLALGARHLPQRATAFTVTFPDRAEDEAAYARATAAHVGAVLVEVPAHPQALADAWPAAVLAGEGLAINAHLPAKWLLARAVRAAGFAAVLTGEGADEVLYGYAHLRHDAGLPEAGEATLERGVMLPSVAGAEGPSLDAVVRRLGSVPTFLRAKAEIGGLVGPLLRDEIWSRFAHVDPAAALVDGAEVSGGSAVEVAARLWSRIVLEGYILRTLGDAMEMAHGVEGRLPFLDRDVVAFLASLPAHHKLAAGGKTPLRDAMAGVLPDAARLRPKQPFLAPPLEGPLLDAAIAAVGAAAFADQSLVDPQRAVQLLTSLATRTPAERRRLDPAAWLVASLAMVHREQT